MRLVHDIQQDRHGDEPLPAELRHRVSGGDRRRVGRTVVGVTPHGRLCLSASTRSCRRHF